MEGDKKGVRLNEGKGDKEKMRNIGKEDKENKVE